MKMEMVRNWMTANPLTVTPSMTVPEANEIMKSARVRRLPVVDSQGAVVGILTQGDLRGADASTASSLSVWELGYLLARVKVKEVMTANPLVVAPDATIGRAAHLMIENKVSGLPVVEDGRLIGIITESDIFSMVVLHEWLGQDIEKHVTT